jgi:hypothetical protein
MNMNVRSEEDLFGVLTFFLRFCHFISLELKYFLRLVHFHRHELISAPCQARNQYEAVSKRSICLAYSSTLKIEAAYSSETWADFQGNTRRYILKYILLHNDLQKTRVEAGSNTSTMTLRVVGGDEMGLKKAAP